MQDARVYFHHEMRRKRTRGRMKSIVLVLLTLLCLGLMIFCLYIYMED